MTSINDSAVIDDIKGLRFDMLATRFQNGYFPSRRVIDHMFANLTEEQIEQIIGRSCMKMKVLKTMFKQAIRRNCPRLAVFFYHRLGLPLSERDTLSLMAVRKAPMIKELMRVGFRFSPQVAKMVGRLKLERVRQLIINFELADTSKSLAPSIQIDSKLLMFLDNHRDIVLDPEVLPMSDKFYVQRLAQAGFKIESIHILFQLLKYEDVGKALVSQYLLSNRDHKLWIIDLLAEIDEQTIAEPIRYFVSPRYVERINTTVLVDTVDNHEIGYKNDTTLSAIPITDEEIEAGGLKLYSDPNNYLLELSELVQMWRCGLDEYDHIISPCYPKHPYTGTLIHPADLYAITDLCRIHHIQLPVTLTILIWSPSILSKMYKHVKNGTSSQAYDICRKHYFSVGLEYIGGDPSQNQHGHWSVRDDMTQSPMMLIYTRPSVPRLMAMLLYAISRMALLIG